MSEQATIFCGRLEAAHVRFPEARTLWELRAEVAEEFKPFEGLDMLEGLALTLDRTLEAIEAAMDVCANSYADVWDGLVKLRLVMAENEREEGGAA